MILQSWWINTISNIPNKWHIRTDMCDFKWIAFFFFFFQVLGFHSHIWCCDMLIDESPRMFLFCEKTINITFERLNASKILEFFSGNTEKL